MKVIDIQQNSDEWLEFRKGKITGSKLKYIISKKGGDKIGFYQLIADRLSLDDGSDDPMERGHALEQEAIDIFMDQTKKEVVPSGMWISDEHPNIACSPDGSIKGKPGKPHVLEAVEIKCLSAARHLEAYFTQKLPSEFDYQALQYFIVNEKLEKLYFCFYDPRVKAVPFFFIEVRREDKEGEIEFVLNFQKETLARIEEMITKLTF